MIEELPTSSSSSSSVIRLATPEDIGQIEELDSLSTSPTRQIHREIEKYFGSVDPTTHERTLIFLCEVDGVITGKAELMLPPQSDCGEGWQGAIGYIKRVIVHPEFRKLGLARSLMQHIIDFSHNELRLAALDLHVWEMNLPAIGLYESLGFTVQHRELYFRLPI
jgi:GNAT superfamily N-acetyltransferase